MYRQATKLVGQEDCLGRRVGDRLQQVFRDGWVGRSAVECCCAAKLAVEETNALPRVWRHRVRTCRKVPQECAYRGQARRVGAQELQRGASALRAGERLSDPIRDGLLGPDAQRSLVCKGNALFEKDRFPSVKSRKYHAILQSTSDARISDK